MKQVKYYSLVSMLFISFLVKGQNIEDVNNRIDSLASQTATLDKVVKGLSKFKVSSYIQGQFQYGQKDASLKVGDTNENPDKGFNRIGIRRGAY